MSPAATLVDGDLPTVLETARSGQVRLAVPGLPRRPYATGQQELCSACVALGVPRPRQGVSRDGAGSAPLCQSCWRARQEREDRKERAELSRLVRDIAVEVEAAEAAEACPACGDAEASPQCWLCSYAWLAQLREQFEDDQAAAAAAAAAAGEDVARLAELGEAEARVADLTGVIERLRRVLAAWENPARVGRWGRAVELVADLLARLQAARTTTRGRPPLTALFGAVLAVDADVHAGRRALPGRLRTAWLLDCSHRAIYDAQKRVVELEWAVRTRRGGRNTLQRRMETGRPNDRAEFDLVQLHTSAVPPAVRAAYVSAALQLLDEVLQRVLAVLEREQDALDELRARADTWTDWAEQARRLQLRAVVARTRTAISPIHDVLAAHAATLTALDTANICHTHTVTGGEYVSSCSYWGLQSSDEIMIHSVGGARPSGRGKGGASRSSTGAGSGDLVCAGFSRSHRVDRPRTRKKVKARSHRRARPVWSNWAYPLARDLVRTWTWLAGVPRPRVAATLGARLGPDWTADQLTRWVSERRDRPVLVEPDAPLGYLRGLLEEALTGATVPPASARRHDEHRAQVAADAHARTAAAHGSLRAAFDERDAAADATGEGRAATRAVLAEIAARRAAAAAACDWPEVAQPGSGAPPRL